MKIIGLLSLLILTACVTREEIEVSIFRNNFNAEELKVLCERDPDLRRFGFYRKIKDGTLEFLSICKPNASGMLSIYETDFNRLMDKALPKKSGGND